MISFPLNLPSELKVQSVDWDANTIAGATTSPFTAEQQIAVHQGEWLELQISCPPMSGKSGAARHAEEVVAWLLSLNGIEGTMLLPPPGYQGARGSLAGVPVVNGAGQSGKTLASRGWTAQAQNVLKAGDWIQLGTGATSRIHKLVQAASADNYGEANLEIWPRLREVPADGDPITVLNPKGIFRLAENKRSWSVGLALIYGISFRVREAL